MKNAQPGFTSSSGEVWILKLPCKQQHVERVPSRTEAAVNSPSYKREGSPSPSRWDSIPNKAVWIQTGSLKWKVWLECVILRAILLLEQDQCYMPLSLAVWKVTVGNQVLVLSEHPETLRLNHHLYPPSSWVPSPGLKGRAHTTVAMINQRLAQHPCTGKLRFCDVYKIPTTNTSRSLKSVSFYHLYESVTRFKPVAFQFFHCKYLFLELWCR